MATVALNTVSVPAAFFGMNLLNSYEDSTTVFPTVVACSSMSSIVIFLGLVYYYKFWPSRLDRKRAQDLAALRELLHHIDDIDDILAVINSRDRPVSREEFGRILRAHPSARFMRKRELDLIFRVFDSNRNGLIEAGAYTAALERNQRARDTHRDFWGPQEAGGSEGPKAFWARGKKFKNDDAE
eukprot:TRINITY_DN4738_c0_g2_i1.p1 TRINITY_DN4738_c0_g2~~TRINITY_DN4738_c0_g2_i1.p1  ORF type:complete len:194 (+),score=40.65 TRINITY_DN4738_c0_g2_i1:33-584(+)